MGFDILQASRLVGHEFVEALHEHRLREHRQLLEGRVAETAVELAIEGRAREGERPEFGEAGRLVRKDLRACPPIVGREHGAARSSEMTARRSIGDPTR